MKKLSTVGIIEYTEITLNGAKQFLCIVSPYLNIKNDYLTLIKAKAKKGIKVVIICGKTALSESELKKLQQIKNLELRFLYTLHAKVLMNESWAITGSMNLYEASEINHEIGWLISQKYNQKQFNDLSKEVYDYMRKSQLYRADIYRKSKK